MHILGHVLGKLIELVSDSASTINRLLSGLPVSRLRAKDGRLSLLTAAVETLLLRAGDLLLNAIDLKVVVKSKLLHPNV